MTQQNIMEDGTPYPFASGPVDNGYKLPINNGATISKMETAQTAVEWLENELHNFIHPEHGKDFLPILEQAKQMEKEQIKTAFKDGVYEGVLTDINYLHCDEEAEFYYNSRYK